MNHFLRFDPEDSFVIFLKLKLHLELRLIEFFSSFRFSLVFFSELVVLLVVLFYLLATWKLAIAIGTRKPSFLAGIVFHHVVSLKVPFRFSLKFTLITSE